MSNHKVSSPLQEIVNYNSPVIKNQIPGLIEDKENLQSSNFKEENLKSLEKLQFSENGVNNFKQGMQKIFNEFRHWATDS